MSEDEKPNMENEGFPERSIPQGVTVHVDMGTEHLVTEEELDEVSIAPRVTAKMIEAAVSKDVPIQWHVFPDSTVTVCRVTLVNGFSVLGNASCVDPANFNEQIGRRLAYEDAKRKIGELEGYLLCQKLYEAV